MSGYKLHLRCLLEGIEVPIVSCVTFGRPNSAQSASVQIVGTTSSLMLKPGTKIHVLYLENVGMLTDPSENKEVVNDVSTPFIYRQLFEGSVIGHNYQRVSVGRTVVLQCLDDSRLWDRTSNGTLGFSGRNINVTVPTNSGGETPMVQVTDPSNEPTLSPEAAALAQHDVKREFISNLKAVMSSGAKNGVRAKHLAHVKGAVGAALNLLVSAGGVYPPESLNGKYIYRGNNAWASYEELRHHVVAQMAADSGRAGDTAFKFEELKKLIFSGHGGIGSKYQVESYRDAALNVLRMVLYQIAPQCCPLYIPPAGAAMAPYSVSSKRYAVATLGPFYETHRILFDQLSGILAAAVPSSDLVSVRVNSLGFRVAGEILGRYQKDYPRFQQMLVNASASEAANILASPDGIQSITFATAAIASINTAAVSAVSSITTGALPEIIQGYITSAVEEIAVMLSTAAVVEVDQKYSTTDHGRLVTQVVMPVAWYAAPPCCNVIFPDQYSSVTFARSFDGEITKLRMQRNTDYKVPPLKGAPPRLMVPLNTSKTKASALEYSLWPTKVKEKFFVAPGSSKLDGSIDMWERFTGPIPRLATLPMIYKLIKSGKTDAYGEGITDALFYQLRYGSRSAQVSMRFSPQIALGFPAGVILQRIISESPDGVPSPTVQEAVNAYYSRGDLPPSQLLGFVSTLTHSVSQANGSSQVGLSYVRTSRSDDEILTAAIKDVKAGTYTKVTRVTYTEAQTKVRSNDSTYMDILKMASLSIPRDDRGTPTWVVEDIEGSPYAGSRNVWVHGMSGIPGPAGGIITELWTDSDSFVGDPDALPSAQPANQPLMHTSGLLNSVLVKESFQTSILLPTATILPEDLMRPMWVGTDEYSNDTVGKLYKNKFLGCQAITSLESPSRSGPSSGTGTDGSQEASMDTIAFLYDRLKRGTTSVESFIDSFTFRPIATMSDLFGWNSELTAEGTVVARVQGEGEESVGFSSGFHQGTSSKTLRGLFGLVGAGNALLKTKLGTFHLPGAKLPLDPTMDVRVERSETVEKYRKELVESGGGLID